MLQQNAVEPTTLELLKRICSLSQFNNFALGGGTNLALRLGIVYQLTWISLPMQHIRIVVFSGNYQGISFR